MYRKKSKTPGKESTTPSEERSHIRLNSKSMLVGNRVVNELQILYSYLPQIDDQNHSFMINGLPRDQTSVNLDEDYTQIIRTGAKSANPRGIFWILGWSLYMHLNPALLCGTCVFAFFYEDEVLVLVCFSCISFFAQSNFVFAPYKIFEIFSNKPY